MEPLIKFNIRIDDGFSFLIFFLFQGFLLFSTFKYWSLKQIKTTLNLNVQVVDEQYKSKEE